MKIEKINNKKRFNFGEGFYCDKNSIRHGLYNHHNKFIGYYYQGKRKGFWLRNYKE
jgi:hypothetical protein